MKNKNKENIIDIYNSCIIFSTVFTLLGSNIITIQKKQNIFNYTIEEFYKT